MKKILLLTSLLLTSCAYGKIEYTPPLDSEAPIRTVVINHSKADIWPQVIRTLGENFFVINNLDKESGLINVSFSGDPERYCDCGIYNTEYRFQLTEQHTFPGSKKKQEYWAVIPWPDRRCVKNRRTMALDGRLNLIVQDQGPNQCAVSVNARYRVTESILSKIADKIVYNTATETVVFESNNHGEFSTGTICWPTGSLETEIIKMITDL